ncbi:VOC family protein [Actinomadura fibrosa]|uniref:VOC family protein n=1 Tax=Actinomadura fibrosa TaxID=111802 RepID=A0ABW2XNT0_9ACTN|nr:VOC family protein [Actinomadura fibrosa]
MPEVSGYDPGWPTWAELASPDPEASRAFYCGLFDWYSYTLTVADLGDYEIFTLGDVQGPEVAGMQTLADDSLPSSWTCYFRTDDVDAAVETVRAAGGQELMEPTDVAGLGRMALCSDLEGADFALWLPFDLRGAGVADEPSAVCWVELACRDVERARRFYGEVFGWKAVDRSYYSRTYTNFKIGEWSVAGLVPLDEFWGPEVPPHWVPYFEVADCDASAERAVGLGARIDLGPTDIAPGRFSVLTDPTGARLTIIKPDRRRHALFDRGT